MNGGGGNKESISVCYQNVRGLRTKCRDFLLSVAISDYDIICVSESGLNENFNDGELVDSSYSVFRKDRSSTTSSKNRGGGVLIACKNTFNAVETSSTNNNVEQVFIHFTYNRCQYIVGCTYIPPNSPLESYTNHMSDVSHIMSKYTNCKTCIFGDYNLPNLQWDPLDECAKNATSLKEIAFCDELSILGLFQLNYIRNTFGVILDLCLTNIQTTVNKCTPLVNEDFYHPAIGLTIETTSRVCPDKEQYFYNFKKANYGQLNNMLLDINWTVIYNLKNIDEIMSVFYEIVYDVIEKCIPKYCLKKSTFPSWFNKDLINTIKKKKTMHKLYKETLDEHYYYEFSSLREICKFKSKTCYNNFVKGAEQSIKSDSSQFWNFIKNKNNYCQELPYKMTWDDKVAYDKLEISNLFADYFGNVYKSSQNSNMQNTFTSEIDVNLSNIEIKYDDLLSTMLSLKINKGPGPDGLPNLFLRECAVSLCEPLCFIFNRCVSTGAFPIDWKHSFVTPVFKSGNKSSISNYRPICIQSAIPKLLEKMLIPTLTNCFKNIIVTNQHGFFGGRSTASNMFPYVNFVLQSMNDKTEVHSIYTDFCKAFDLVDHEILIVKLHAYGIRSPLCDFFKSYITGRTQQVKVKGSLSNHYAVFSGVPQGSHLAPILFSIFINDIGNNFTSRYLLFADDLKIYRDIKTISDSMELQSDIDLLNDWCVDNKLKLNINKCSFIIFIRGESKFDVTYTINNTNLIRVYTVKDLGISLDYKLNFNNHYDNLISKANRNLGFIFRNTKDFLDPSSVITLYNSLVRSSLEYSSIIWMPHYETHKSRFFQIEKKFLKYMNFFLSKNNILLNMIETSEYLNFQKLELRWDYLAVCFFYKLISNRIDSPDCLANFDFHIAPRHLRSQSLLHLRTYSTFYAQNCPANRISRSVNGYDLDYFSNSLSIFKNRARNVIVFKNEL